MTGRKTKYHRFISQESALALPFQNQIYKKHAGGYLFTKASSTIQNSNRHEDLCLLFLKYTAEDLGRKPRHPGQTGEDRTSSARTSAVLKQQYLMLDLKT
jgi:poly-gamma-glutamate capsule biosynthesis protein CapA/YwtB (metallophosphatase superfamily)